MKYSIKDRDQLYNLPNFSISSQSNSEFELESKTDDSRSKRKRKSLISKSRKYKSDENVMIIAVVGEDNMTLDLNINPQQSIYVLEGLMYWLITSNHQWNIAKSSILVNKQKYLVYKKI